MSSSSSASHVPVVVVTGAGSGIGAAVAQRFAREGWDVVLMGRRRDALQVVAGTLGTHGFVVPMDIADAKSTMVIKNWAAENPGISSRITALVHNAGIFEVASTMKSEDASWHRIFETNVFGVIRLTQVLYPFLKSNQGSITNVSSTLGLRPTPETPAYSASKAALINWGHSFAKEVAGDRVRVNCVCPGVVDTPIHSVRPGGAAVNPAEKTKLMNDMGAWHPLGRVGRPEEIAHMIWALSGPGSEWTTGAVVSVDGGIHLV